MCTVNPDDGSHLGPARCLALARGFLWAERRRQLLGAQVVISS
jgi:hypothetical protein